jgi:hypothetical protein
MGLLERLLLEQSLVLLLGNLPQLQTQELQPQPFLILAFPRATKEIPGSKDKLERLEQEQQ